MFCIPSSLFLLPLSLLLPSFSFPSFSIHRNTPNPISFCLHPRILIIYSGYLLFPVCFSIFTEFFMCLPLINGWFLSADSLLSCNSFSSLFHSSPSLLHRCGLCFHLQSSFAPMPVPFPQTFFLQPPATIHLMFRFICLRLCIFPFLLLLLIICDLITMSFSFELINRKSS